MRSLIWLLFRRFSKEKVLHTEYGECSEHVQIGSKQHPGARKIRAYFLPYYTLKEHRLWKYRRKEVITHTLIYIEVEYKSHTTLTVSGARTQAVERYEYPQIVETELSRITLNRIIEKSVRKRIKA